MVFSFLKSIQIRRRVARNFRTLSALDDAMLCDIGLDRRTLQTFCENGCTYVPNTAGRVPDHRAIRDGWGPDVWSPDVWISWDRLPLSVTASLARRDRAGAGHAPKPVVSKSLAPAGGSQPGMSIRFCRTCLLAASAAGDRQAGWPASRRRDSRWGDTAGTAARGPTTRLQSRTRVSNPGGPGSRSRPGQAEISGSRAGGASGRGAIRTSRPR